MIAVVVPCYEVRDRILPVLARIGPEVGRIFVVDDACPQGTGAHVRENCIDPRVRVIVHEANQGVGGAVVTGYEAALAEGAEIVVKLDGDGQMDPALIPRIVAPIRLGIADYAKGNRFFNPEDAHAMPKARLLGNLALSFLTKLSSGYWNIFDPTNGFTAIHRFALSLLPLDKVNRQYFFESDMLFRLNTVRAVVVDVPMTASYDDESSNLKLTRAAWEFPLKHLKRMAKRIAYMYFLRDFNVASIHLVLGGLLSVFGIVFGLVMWYRSLAGGEPATAGTVMLSALPIILGMQMLIAFLSHDHQSVPRVPLVQVARPGEGQHGPGAAVPESLRDQAR